MDRADSDYASHLEELDRRFVLHPFTVLADHQQASPGIMVEGKGAVLRDSQGREYIDAMAGLWCANVGYGSPELAECMKSQTLKLSYYHSFSGLGTDAPAVLSEKLIKMAPARMSKVFFGNSGSDANDTQVKLVWYYNNLRGLTDKKKIISRKRGYHGVTVMSASLTGFDNLHKGFDLPLPMVRHVSAPYRLWGAEPGMSDEAFAQKLADELEQVIIDEGPETVGAFIAEPVQGAGGVIVPPQGYFTAIQKVLKKYDVLFIADEVISGFGRLGKNFGCEVFGIEPDLITIAKGITSAYVPLSGCLVSEKIWSVMVEGSAKYGAFGHGFTYSSHPIAAAVALENLALIERDCLVERAAETGAHLRQRLNETFADHPMLGEVRGMGFVAAVEFVAKNTGKPQAFDPQLKVAARIAKKAFARGVIVRALPAADTISFSPPFVTTKAQVDRCVETVRKAADDVMDELVRERQWQAA
jgi:L-2,4-diaminobutyrate transaminase